MENEHEVHGKPKEYEKYMDILRNIKNMEDTLE
jgi:hypothetical protein